MATLPKHRTTPPHPPTDPVAEPRYRPPSGREPCNDCPFRRISPPGWLGAATPESFIVEISMERPLPCHPTIDYEDPRWLARWTAQETGRICAGSLILSANMCKRPRDRDFPRLPADTERVFATHQEFIDHHRASPVRSWETDDSHEIRHRPTPPRRARPRRRR